MARVLQLRRGTNVENNLFTGAVAEATYDTDRKELRVHDGSTVGGKVVSVPTGAVMAFAGSSAPEGWLVCDGSAISRTIYADLFAVIGTTYGAGDGNSTFEIPDLSGRLPVYDGTATIGDTTNGKAPNIKGYVTNITSKHQPTSSGALYSSGFYYQNLDNTSGNDDGNSTINIDASRCSAVYDDNANGIVPAGVYMNWVIKF